MDNIYELHNSNKLSKIKLIIRNEMLKCYLLDKLQKMDIPYEIKKTYSNDDLNGYKIITNIKINLDDCIYNNVKMYQDSLRIIQNNNKYEYVIG